MERLDSYAAGQAPGFSGSTAVPSVPFTPPGLNVLLDNHRTCLCLNPFVRFSRNSLCVSGFRPMFKEEKGSSAINKRRNEMLSAGGMGEFSNETGVLQLSPVFRRVFGGFSVPFLFTLPESYVLLGYHITCLCLNVILGGLRKLLSHISLKLNYKNEKGVLKCEKGEMQLLHGPQKGRNAMRGEFYNYKEEAYV